MEVEKMLFVLWYEFDPDHTERVRELWKHFKFPENVKVIGRYVLIGRHTSVASITAQDYRPVQQLWRGPHRAGNAARRGEPGNVVRKEEQTSTNRFPDPV